MKRLLQVIAISVLASVVLSNEAAGQKTYALGIGGGAAIPVGKLGDTQVTGFNGIVALAVGVAELSIGLRFDGILSLIHISEPTRLGMISYAVFCLKKKKS